VGVTVIGSLFSDGKWSSLVPSWGLLEGLWWQVYHRHSGTMCCGVNWFAIYIF
jgi:hypothetical protein